MEISVDHEPLLDQTRQLTQNESRKRYYRRNHSFLRTVCTICLTAALGAFGIWFSVGYYYNVNNGNWTIETVTGSSPGAGSDSEPDSPQRPKPDAPQRIKPDAPQRIKPDAPQILSQGVVSEPHQDLPQEVESHAPQCSSIPHVNRQDCWPQSTGVLQQKCEQRGCCWNPSYTPMLGGEPFCFYPSDYQGYTVESIQRSDTGVKVMLQLSKPSGWPNDVQHLALDVTFHSAQKLHFKFYDPNNARYEVPITLSESTNQVTAVDTEYNIDIPSQGRFYITVTRKSTGKVLFSTRGATPLVFADQFIQVGTQLSTRYIYGLGEHRSAFLVSTNWTKLAFWSRDQPPSLHSNLYGVQPFYLNIEDDNNAHGVFLLNSNAMEVEVQPSPALTYRTTGGVLDFYVFAGPTPDNVIQQYTELIGRPFMPPYWALGFHLCRWGYDGIDGMKKVIKRMRDAKMPYDTQWNDIDYMKAHLDWTYDTGAFNGLPDVVADLHQKGQRYIMIIDPGISNVQPSGSYPPFDDGIKMDVFIKTTDGSAPIIGKVWPGTTAFPDFFHPNATAYWTKQAKAYHDMVPFDGIWIDMNEPSNFVAGSMSGCPSNTLENPPFVPPVLLGGTLKDKTLCASARQHISSHYNLHSLYGHSEAVVTKSALDSIKGNKRSIVISRSTYPSTGVHSGHWLGDNNAQWIDTYYSISGMLNFNLFGMPLVGADICGFNGNTNTELCTRWMQLGAFYPFMRNHNTIGDKDQDPASFDEATQKIMRDALNLRYTLLPFLYTLFYRSHMDGLPVVRPLFFQYPESDDNVTYMNDVQFMWGSALLVTPTTSEGTTEGRGYLPRDRWYDWFNRSYIDSPGNYITFDLPMEHINLQVRGGSILPLQFPNITTTLARKSKFIVYSALDASGSASGELYWDDGESRDSISAGTYNLIRFQLSQSLIGNSMDPDETGSMLVANAVSTFSRGTAQLMEYFEDALKNPRDYRTLTSTVTLAGYRSGPMILGELYVLGVEVGPTSVTVNGKVIPGKDYIYSNKTLIVQNLSEDLLKTLQVSWLV